jgi:uncharacterized protein
LCIKKLQQKCWQQICWHDIFATKVLATNLLGKVQGASMSSGLKRTIGNWVEGDRFWDREIEMELFIEKLDEGDHLLLIAQRRIGKTSLMRQASRLIQDRFVCLHVDLQEAASAADAVAELSVETRKHTSLWGKTKDIFVNIARTATENIDSLQVADLKVTLRSGMTEGDWQAKGDRLFAILADSDKPVVIFLDEVPILVSRLLKGNDYAITPERRTQADVFMSWLRSNSLKHQGKVRLVVTGSIGLEPILKQAGLSATINHFAPFELGPWTAEAAQGCIEALAEEYNLEFEEGAIAQMVECIGICIPYHVQLFFDLVYQSSKMRKIETVSKKLISEIYETKMLSTRGHAELSHLEERLKMVLGPTLHPLALDLLTETSVTGHLTPEASAVFGREYGIANDVERPEDVVREVLNILEHDGYLQRDGETYEFVSRLVKDWWNASHRFNFITAAKRLGA